MTTTPAAAPRSPRKLATALPTMPPPMMTILRIAGRRARAMPAIVARSAWLGTARSVSRQRPKLDDWRSGGAALDARTPPARYMRVRRFQLRRPHLVVAHIHQTPQLIAPTRQARADRADRDAENLGDLLVAHAFEPDEQDHLALFLRQLGDRGLKVAQLKYIHGVGLDRQDRGHLLDRDIDPLADRAAHVVDMLIVQDCEEPGPQIGAGLPQMLLGDRPGQTALDEIVGAGHVPGQRASIAAQPRDFRLKQPSEIVHGSPHSCVSVPPLRGVRRLTQDKEEDVTP